MDLLPQSLQRMRLRVFENIASIWFALAAWSRREKYSDMSSIDCEEGREKGGGRAEREEGGHANVATTTHEPPLSAP